MSFEKTMFDDFRARPVIGTVGIINYPNGIKVTTIKKKYVEQMEKLPLGHNDWKHEVKILGKVEHEVIVGVSDGDSGMVLKRVHHNDMRKYFYSADIQLQDVEDGDRTPDIKFDHERAHTYADRMMKALPQMFND